MPLVKVIGPKPGTSSAAKALEDLRNYTTEPVATTSRSPPPPSPPEPKSSKEIETTEDTHIELRRKKGPYFVDDAPEDVQTMRALHCRFIVSVHLHAIGYLIIAITQWTFLYHIQSLVLFAKMHYYLALIPFVLSFLMLMCLLFFYDNLTKHRGKVIFYTYTAIMLQLATIAIAMPFSTSICKQLLLSCIIAVPVILTSIVLASSRYDFYLHTPQYIIAWTFRCFIVTSLGIIIGISLKSPYYDVVMTMIMCFFMSIFIMICGKTLSRAEFIWLDRYGPHLYGTLFYLNYIILYSMALLLFEEVDEVLRI